MKLIILTNSDQDVSLDEMVKRIEHFMTDNDNDSRWSIDMTIQSMDVIITNENGKIRRGEWSDSLDIIREIEETLDSKGYGFKYTKYVLQLMEETDYENATGWDFLTTNPETRLRAIYKTLKENGEINGT